MSEEFGLNEFERFQVVHSGDEDEADAPRARRSLKKGMAFAARVTQPVLHEPGAETWLNKAEQTLVFVKRLYQTRA
jgi:hypothetical protein